MKWNKNTRERSYQLTGNSEQLAMKSEGCFNGTKILDVSRGRIYVLAVQPVQVHQEGSVALARRRARSSSWRFSMANSRSLSARQSARKSSTVPLWRPA